MRMIATKIVGQPDIRVILATREGHVIFAQSNGLDADMKPYCANVSPPAAKAVARAILRKGAWAKRLTYSSSRSGFGAAERWRIRREFGLLYLAKRV